MTQAIANNVTKLSLSVPAELNLACIVRETAERKAKIGTTFQTKQGDNSLRSGVAAFVKSCRGLGKTEKLSEADMAKIDEAITQFWSARANELLNYGTVTKFTKNKPFAEYENGDVLNIGTRATMVAEKYHSDSERESKLYCLFMLNTAKGRLQKMLNDTGRYDRNQIAAQRLKLDALTRKFQQLDQIHPDRKS